LTITRVAFARSHAGSAEGETYRAKNPPAMFLPLVAAVIVDATPPTAADVAALANTVGAIASTHPMDTARLGVSVVEADDGHVLFQRDADDEFAPASNFKLLVAATALSYLGPQFRYETRLVARGPVRGGTLFGDLILVAGGDPILSRPDLAHAVAAVKAAGIERVAGTLLVDDSIFDEQRYGAGWAWDDFPYYYQPPVQALSIDEGLANVTVVPGAAEGDPASASIEPNGGAMTVASRAVTTAPDGADDPDCFRSPGSTRIIVVGHVPVSTAPQKFGCAVDDSAAYAVSTFAGMLRAAGVFVGDSPVGPQPPRTDLDVEDASPWPPPRPLPYGSSPAATLWTHRSLTIAELIARMMPPSDNFIAEHLFKMLPVVALGQRGSFDGGAAVERKFLASLGLDPASLDGGDGSGLSQGDRITPRDLTTILEWETRSSTGDDFVGALAIAGVKGTVRHRLLGSDAVGRVRAKDGYIWHVSALSGYAQTLHHGLVVFSVIFNDANGPLDPFLASEDKIVETIVDWP
jgi:D-alanyl-D-alanine carboxypeptidase/D-alanyl-D-alanine-endopeptidase (penicillin-binding protein 4)